MSPRVLLRSILALDDSPHAIALGASIGIFVGLTPSVGIQTILILAVVFLTRPFFYFNGTAAMATTYISNPLTMGPLYYFWYRLGAWFFPGYSKNIDFSPLLQFEGLSGWWASTCELAVQVGLPMLTGALLTAPLGAAVAYPLTHFLVRWFRNSGSSTGQGGNANDASSNADSTASHEATSPDKATSEEGPAADSAVVSDSGKDESTDPGVSIVNPAVA